MNRKIQVAAWLGATMLSAPVWAQDVDEVIVLSSPFQKSIDTVISTVEVIDAEALQSGLEGPIGNVLSALPGVDSAGFGPAVGQPLIRGLGGYRVDTMANGMTVADIVAAGSDHANALSLYDVDRLEVLKGPAALRYGAFAATGVVNSFNRHMQRDAEDATEVTLGYGDNADEAIGAFFARRGAFALSAFTQDADNITIPTHGETEAYHELHEEEEEEGGGHEEEALVDAEQEADDTQSESLGFTASAHFGDDETNLSVMARLHEQEYGVPGHAHGGVSAYIDMEQETLQARLMHNGAIWIFDSLQADLTFSTLDQTEFEGAEAGTVFDQDSLHLRTEGKAEINDWQTLIGFEYRDAELETTAAEHEGEESHGTYLPPSERTQYGLFGFGQNDTGDWLSELAGRFDNVELTSNPVAHDEEEAGEGEGHDEPFAGDVSFDLVNLSAGLARRLDNDWLIGGSISSTERAPSEVELFADGVHEAAGRFEEGDHTLDKETALATEVYLRRAWGLQSLRLALFKNDYSDFIYLKRNAALDITEGGETTPGYEYAQQDADVSGFEAEYLTDLQVAGRMLDVTLRYSTVEGELDDGSNIPAMPADKIGLGMAMSFDALRVSVDVENAADQDDTATGELKTDGYTNVDVSASYQPPQYEGLTIIASVRNATDEEIRQHASPLKDRLPEPGQDFRLTARYKF